MLNYDRFIKESNTDLPKGLPEYVSGIALKIARSMFDKVGKYSFFEENGDYYLRFTVNDMDFKYVDPYEVLSVDMLSNSKRKRTYYVELEYDDQIPSTNEVIYKIIFVKN